MTPVPGEPLPFTPVVIIGAGRSGTNALRNALTRVPGLATWPCDEINPIWRHGNTDWPNDAIPADRATSAVKDSIRAAFRRIWRQKRKPPFIVEKTCANALRIPFVDQVLPEARYIHIVRNGLDVVASAQRRWRGELELAGLPYFLAKARYAPLSDLPRYAAATLRNRFSIKLGLRKQFDFWGPRFEGAEALSTAPLVEIVARQWAACVTSSDAAFARMDSSRVFLIRYEDLTADPVHNLTRIAHWLGAPPDSCSLRAAAALVHPATPGDRQAVAGSLTPAAKAALDGPMKAHGYWRGE
jgi:hypothetical protein